MTIRKALIRQPWIAVLLAGAVAAPALSACGSGAGAETGGDDDATALLDRAFAKPVPSADVDVDAELEIEGLDGLDEPLRIAADGVYVRAERGLPKLDLDVVLETQGAGQAIESGVLSTGDRLFLKFGGAFYEQDSAAVARTNRQLAGDRGGGAFGDLGLDPSRWVLDARIEGEDEIGGVTTEHVTGTLDFEALLTDLNRLVKRSAGALSGAGDRARPLRPAEVERLARSVHDPSFDVYVGKRDDIVRRITVRLDADVPEEERDRLDGVTGASIRLSAQLEQVGGDQRVAAPPSSRPLSDLMSQIGSSRSLAGDGGGPAAGGDDSGGGADFDAFERYSACLDAADPDDAAAIERCRALLP